MTVRALIFDFDGLILDTETPEVEVWKAIYAEHGFEYSKEHWSQIIGGWGNSVFDPADTLQQLSSRPLDLEAIRKRQREESNARVMKQPVMAGVFDYVRSARALGLRLAIASSSERGAWTTTEGGRSTPSPARTRSSPSRTRSRSIRRPSSRTRSPRPTRP